MIPLRREVCRNLECRWSPDLGKPDLDLALAGRPQSAAVDADRKARSSARRRASIAGTGVGANTSRSAARAPPVGTGRAKNDKDCETIHVRSPVAVRGMLTLTWLTNLDRRAIRGAASGRQPSANVQVLRNAISRSAKARPRGGPARLPRREFVDWSPRDIGATVRLRTRSGRLARSALRRATIEIPGFGIIDEMQDNRIDRALPDRAEKSRP